MERLAEINDIDEIMEALRGTIALMEKNDIFQWDKTYPSEEDFLVDIGKKQLYVLETDKKIAAVFAVNNECDEQYKNGLWKYNGTDYIVIHRLFVRNDCQNKGLGKRLMANIATEAAKAGIKAIRLDAFEQNPKAVTLYKNQGYSVVGTAEWRERKFLLMEKIL